ncbi:T9SS type A sorting domain-containing protein [bacterium]|nr:T9SS type A sorting domain-containing protein [bacterium]
MMKILICLSIMSIYALSVMGQPQLRPGWPQQISPAGASGTANNLAVGTIPEYGDVISACTNQCIALLTTDGQFLPGWPIELDYNQDGLLVQGIRWGDLLGDEQLEFVIRLWQQDEGNKIYVYSLAGERLPFDLNLPPPAAMNRPFGAHVLINVDDDDYDELFFVADSLVYGLNGDGSSLPGFPKYAGVVEAAYFGAPCLGIGDNWHSDPAIFWTTGTTIQAKYLQSGEDIAGYPVAIDVDATYSPLTLISDADGWFLTFVDKDSLYAFDEQGQSLPGFPVRNPYINGVSEVSYDVVAADLDGDAVPELLFHPFDEHLYAFRTDGSSFPGFPIEMPNVIGAGEPPVVLRRIGSLSASIFLQGVNTPSSCKLYGYELNQPISGFPINVPITYPVYIYGQTACFPPAAGSMILVTFNSNGQIAAYDVPMEGGDYSMEWPMPGCNVGGNRLYQPQIFSDVDEPDPMPATQTLATVYPNPSNGSFRITVQADGLGEAHISIHNVLGQLVYQANLHAQPGELLNHNWNPNNSVVSASTGLYLATLAGKERSTHKIVLLH